MLQLLSGAGADLAHGGVRAGVEGRGGGGGGGRGSAAQVLREVMLRMCDVREAAGGGGRGWGGLVGGVEHGKEAAERATEQGKEKEKEKENAGARRLAACVGWQEKWAVACVAGGVMRADEMGRTPLHAAALAGNANALQLLLQVFFLKEKKSAAARSVETLTRSHCCTCDATRWRRTAAECVCVCVCVLCVVCVCVCVHTQR